jgi:hypothetical protein
LDEKGRTVALGEGASDREGTWQRLDKRIWVGGPGRGTCNEYWYASIRPEFFIWGGSEPEAMYNVCVGFENCFKNHSINITVT